MRGPRTLPRHLVERYTIIFHENDTDGDGYLEIFQANNCLNKIFSEYPHPRLRGYVEKHLSKYSNELAVRYNGKSYMTLLTILSVVRDIFHEEIFVSMHVRSLPICPLSHVE